MLSLVYTKKVPFVELRFHIDEHLILSDLPCVPIGLLFKVLKTTSLKNLTGSDILPEQRIPFEHNICT